MSIELVCMNCGDVDGKTNAGALFCHVCSDDLDDTAKDKALDEYLRRMSLLRASFRDWEQAA